MKRLVILVVVLAALGGIAWGVGAMATRTTAERWIAARAAYGWVAHADAISVGGFPLAFRTRFTDLELADPATGLAWTAPRFDLEHRVLRLDQLSAIWPDAQLIGSPEERLTVTSTAMTAALDVQPTARFALDAMQARMADVFVRSTAGWQLALQTARLDVTRVAGTVARYDLAFEAAALVPPDALRVRLDPGSLLPEAIDRATARATIAFDAPWDIAAIEVARPQITAIAIDEINATWGDMLFRAAGDLAVTPGGIPEGDLAIRAENWRAMVDLAENSGLLPARLRPTAEAMLGVLAGMSGSAENIDATLSFSNGRVFVGPLPIGPAPSLRLR